MLSRSRRDRTNEASSPNARTQHNLGWSLIDPIVLTVPLACDATLAPSLHNGAFRGGDASITATSQTGAILGAIDDCSGVGDNIIITNNNNVIAIGQR